MTNLVEFSAGGSLNERVAEEVRALMARRRVTQTMLASALRISQVSVSERLRGKTPFTLADIEVLSDYFGVTPAALFGYAAAPNGPNGDGGASVSPLTRPGSMATRGYPHPIAA